MRVVTLRGRVSFWDHFVRGSVIIFLRDVVRISCIFSFLSLLGTVFLYMRSCDHYRHTLYLFSLILLMYIFSFTYPFICCFFSLFIHMLLIYLYAIYYFYFTQRCLDEFCLKCFRNTGCQSLLVINSLLTKFFKSLC